MVAEEVYVDRQIAVTRDVEKCGSCVPPILCEMHSAFFTAHPYIYLAEEIPVDKQSCGGVEYRQAESGGFAAVVTTSGECENVATSGGLCVKLGIHVDPWLT